VVSTGIGRAQRVTEPEVRLREALHKEQVEGDLAGAIKIYETVASDAQAPRAVMAQALLYAGRCYEKLRRPEAQRAYERIVQQFTDQPAIVAEARSRLTTGDRRASSFGLSATKLATFDNVRSSNVSADGRSAIVSRDRVLSIGDVTTGELRRLQNDPLRVRATIPGQVVSPDGRQIAYVVVEDGSPTLRRASPGEAPRVTSIRLQSQRAVRGVRLMDWSRDGGQIAAVVFWQNGQPGSAGDSFADIGIVDVADGAMRILESALALPAAGAQGIIAPTRLRFSPNGRYLAFEVRRTAAESPTPVSESDSRPAGIFTVHANGTGADRLAIGHEPAELYGWLPDGSAILFVREIGGVRVLSALPVNGTRARGTAVVLMRGIGEAEPLGVSTGGALVYTIDGSSRKSYTVDLATNPAERRSIDDSGHASVSNVSWSPDGRQLAYVVVPMQNRLACRLMVRDLGTGKDRAVLNWEGGLGRGASWSPDGQSVLIVRNLAAEGGVNRVDKVTVTTGAVELIAQIPGQLALPRMSPDGRYVYLLINSQVERIDLRTSERIKFSVVAEPTFDLSRDGKRLALVVREAGASLLKELPTAGGEGRIVFRPRPQERISVAWKPGSDALFLAKQNAEVIQLFELDTSSSEPRPLPVFVKTLADISVHPDGRQLAFLDVDWLVDFWRIDGLSEAFAAASRASSVPLRAPSGPGRLN
jgi:Tol biopolymer transport system component